MSQATQTQNRNANRNEPRATNDQDDFQKMMDGVCTSVKDYSNKHPSIVTAAVFLAGFYIGWKVKPW